MRTPEVPPGVAGAAEGGACRAEVEAAGHLIRMALAEDLGTGDRTGEWTVPPGAQGEARVVARAEGVVCGAHVAKRVFEIVDSELAVRVEREDGARLTAGEVVIHVSGSLRSILAAERTSLNFLARLSGIATLTARFVAATADTACRVADTRKTTPGWRALEKYAVATGGGMNHRFGLFDMVVIKENHIRAAGGVVEALEAASPRARQEGLEVEVEVTNEDELRQALQCRPDRVLLDNMTVDRLAEAVMIVHEAPAPRPLIEASGGVTLDSVRDIARTGVDYVSAGALTHSAPAMDYSLLVTDR